MSSDSEQNYQRYDRQIRFAPLGPAGQERLFRSRVLIVGAGGLGSNLAEHLARAGVGHLRLVDDDPVELVNLHRQHLYDEGDVAASIAKPIAAAQHLRDINSQVSVEAIVGRLRAANAADLVEGINLALDGTDNWPSRFILNDVCVKMGIPWIFAGVVAAEAVTMTVVPGQTACLRCVMDGPPAGSPTCRQVGVLGPAVSVIAGFQAIEAIKILTGNLPTVNRGLTRYDLWANKLNQISTDAGNDDCPCCRMRKFPFLEGTK